MADSVEVSGGAAPRRQARGARTRARLLDATLKLIAQKGMGAFTARDVVGEAGCSLGVLTHHFPTRRDLVAAALTHHGNRQETRAQEAEPRNASAATPDAATLGDLTDRAIVLLAARVHSERETFLAGLEFELEVLRDPTLGADLEAKRDDYREAIEAIVRDADSDEPELDAELLALALQGLGLAWIRHEGDDAFSGQLGLAVRRLVERLLAPGD
jgi:AcrR family transcriptional regulator